MPKIERLDKVQIDPSIEERKISIKSTLNASFRERLVSFLTKNSDVFTWTHEDIYGIDPKIITHQLNVDPTHKAVKQKRRKLGPERNQIINDEVKRLLKAGFIREVHYPDWLANMVIVKKKNIK